MLDRLRPQYHKLSYRNHWQVARSGHVSYDAILKDRKIIIMLNKDNFIAK